jgi:hypothetical protein
MKRFRSTAVLAVVVCFLVGYNFMSAQWTPASGTPPAGNTPAPINVGGTTQAKSGNFMANILAAATSTWSPRYCDELGNNCWDPGTGAPGGNSSTTITVGGQCFEPAWAVTCNWNWSGDGNDNSTYIRPMNGTPQNVCASVNRSYQYHTIVLAECSTPVYGWVVGAWACNAPMAWSCSTTNGRIVRTVECRDQFGSIVSDSNCTAPKPSSDNGPCTRRGSGSDC